MEKHLVIARVHVAGKRWALDSNYEDLDISVSSCLFITLNKKFFQSPEMPHSWFYPTLSSLAT